MKLRRFPLGFAVTGATIALSATPVFAHDCFNPTKDAHAPTAGVNYTITDFDPATGPVFKQTGPGKGIGGFAAIAPGLLGPDQTETIYVHTLGNSGHELVGGPGSQKDNHSCDGKGIDYLDACS